MVKRTVSPMVYLFLTCPCDTLWYIARSPCVKATLPQLHEPQANRNKQKVCVTTNAQTMMHEHKYMVLVHANGEHTAIHVQMFIAHTHLLSYISLNKSA